MDISVDMHTGVVTINRCGHVISLDLTSSEGLAAFRLAVQQMETIGLFAAPPAKVTKRELVPA